MATSFTKVWLSLKHRARSRAVRTHDTTSPILIKDKRNSHQKFVQIIISAEARESSYLGGYLGRVTRNTLAAYQRNKIHLFPSEPSFKVQI